MIGKLKEISDLILLRFNDAFASSFILSLAIVNSRGIMIFLYSDNQAKINILKSWEFSLKHDFATPFLMALAYTSLVPLIGVAYKKIVTNHVFKCVHAVNVEKRLISERGQMEVVMAQAKNTPEYASKYIENELEQWIKQKTETLEILNNQEQEIGNYKKRLMALDEASLKSIYYSAIYDRYSNSLQTMSSSIERLNSGLPLPHLARAYGGKINHSEIYIKIINELSLSIRHLFEINNSKPTATFGEWHPPLDEGPINEFFEKFELIEKDANLSEGKVPQSTLDHRMNGSDGK